MGAAACALAALPDNKTARQRLGPAPRRQPPGGRARLRCSPAACLREGVRGQDECPCWVMHSGCRIVVRPPLAPPGRQPLAGGAAAHGSVAGIPACRRPPSPAPAPAAPCSPSGAKHTKDTPCLCGPRSCCTHSPALASQTRTAAPPAWASAAGPPAGPSPAATWAPSGDHASTATGLAPVCERRMRAWRRAAASYKTTHGPAASAASGDDGAGHSASVPTHGADRPSTLSSSRCCSPEPEPGGPTISSGCVLPGASAPRRPRSTGRVTPRWAHGHAGETRPAAHRELDRCAAFQLSF
jgi:hypothetical protein